MTHPEALQQLQELIKTALPLTVRAGGSKSALSGAGKLDMSELSGVSEYNPQEYTFTALAGTPLAEVSALLGGEGQFLPFDPPFAEAGATLGGTVAAGLSGPGRYRYGGVRDFLLGVTLVNGLGDVVRGGGKVVKNAAGFDFPKLMVGSLGQFGVMTELTFKVFPAPESYATLQFGAADVAQANALLQMLARSGFEPYALELLPPNRVLARFGGSAEALAPRLERVQALAGAAERVLTGAAEAQLWQQANAFSWLPDAHALVKIVHSPAQLTGLEGDIADLPHRYSVGGNSCYLAWPSARPVSELDALLVRHKLSGLRLTGPCASPQLGARVGGAFLERVLRVFDPEDIFSKDVTHAA